MCVLNIIATGTRIDTCSQGCYHQFNSMGKFGNNISEIIKGANNMSWFIKIDQNDNRK